MTTSTPDDAATDATAAGPDPRTAAVLRDLAMSIALLPQAPQPEGGGEQPDGAIALPVIEQEGRRYIPVFTSEEALRSLGADPATALRIPIAQLAANWPSDDMWLAVNPASEEGLGLPPDVVRTLPVFAAGPDGASETTPPG
ncbi:SseB family protein [Pseudonocardia sp.]|uniref:SseB family protein n=1 Tax=Pseudonocardia sp. TaxID=60912 RepID=UPI0031FCA589